MIFSVKRIAEYRLSNDSQRDTVLLLQNTARQTRFDPDVAFMLRGDVQSLLFLFAKKNSKRKKTLGKKSKYTQART